MVSLPHAVSVLGWPAGITLLLVVAALTYWTECILVDGTAATGATSYPELALQLGGPALAFATRGSVSLFCFGFATIYLVVIGEPRAQAARRSGLPAWRSSAPLVPACHSR